MNETEPEIDHIGFNNVKRSSSSQDYKNWGLYCQTNYINCVNHFLIDYISPFLLKMLFSDVAK